MSKNEGQALWDASSSSDDMRECKVGDRMGFEGGLLAKLEVECVDGTRDGIAGAELMVLVEEYRYVDADEEDEKLLLALL